MKTILHLCADIGSDSYPYQLDPDYEVIKIGKEIGVENYSPDRLIHGIIANPPCTEFSTARSGGIARENDIGFELLNHCQRIIKEANPKWWVLENPATGTMKNHIGNPIAIYHPWQYGSPWTKKTALWGKFVMPEQLFTKWEDVPKNNKLYLRQGNRYTGKPAMYQLHKSAIEHIPEFEPFKPFVDSDNAFRSLCSQGFANAFKEVNP